MPTLLAYRQYLAKELGGFLASTSSGSSTTVALIDTTWPVTSTLSQDDYYTDYYLMRPDAALTTDRVRLVKSYTPSLGTLTPDTAWTNPPGEAEAYELHGVINPVTELLDCINAALKRTLIRTEIVGTPIANVTRHSLASMAPWLSNPQWVRQVGWLGENDDRNQTNPYRNLVRGQAIEDDSASISGVAIEHPGYSWTGTESLYIRLLKSAYDHCRPAAGAFGNQSGLVLDSDQAPVDVEWLGAAALVEVWRRNSQVLETASRARQLPNLLDAAARMSYLTHINFSPWPLTLIPYEGGGPRHSNTSGWWG
jgi:hypothetical protein